ncbi:hypothetical protein FRC07_005107 [Ceratobasidium sp. 392]|nr:hypothetical protein FRC07_005107 [Ceratobasidium sp. 392]
MSSSLESNNSGSPPDLPSPDHKYTRDPKYYFHDGSAIFLVGDALFKFQASLLAPNSSKVTFRVNPSSEALTLFDFSDTTSGKPGSSDDNPVKIPFVTASDFRWLMRALLEK